MTTVSAAFAFGRGSIELQGLFGLWSIFVGWRLYWMRPGIRRKALRIFGLIKALDILFAILVPVVIFPVLIFGSATGMLHVSSPANLYEVLWSFAAMAFLVADFFFARWALEKLRSSEFEELLGYGALEKSRVSRFSVASAFLWTTVIACALSTYQYDIQQRPISRSSSTRGSYFAGGINVFYARVWKRSTFGSMEVFITQVMVLAPEKEHSPDEYLQPLDIGDDVVYLDGKRLPLPLNHNVVFLNPDGSEESEYLPLNEMQYDSYLDQCGNSNVAPSLAGLKEFLGKQPK